MSRSKLWEMQSAVDLSSRKLWELSPEPVVHHWRCALFSQCHLELLAILLNFNLAGLSHPTSHVTDRCNHWQSKEIKTEWWLERSLSFCNNTLLHMSIWRCETVGLVSPLDQVLGWLVWLYHINKAMMEWIVTKYCASALHFPMLPLWVINTSLKRLFTKLNMTFIH